MERTSNKLQIFGMLIFFINNLLVGFGLGQNSDLQRPYEGYYLYLDSYPDNNHPSWGDNGDLTNGIAHDEANWYISAGGSDIFGAPDNTWVIWQIPVSEALNQDFSGNSAVSTVHLDNVPALKDMRYGHAGDLDVYRYQGTDYLFVPLTGFPLYDDNLQPIPDTTPPPAIGVFNVPTLSFINYAILPGQSGAGWCAVNPNGDIFSSENHTDTVRCYTIEWSRLANASDHNFLTYDSSYQLKDEFDNTLLLRHMQGGEFTQSGELLYVNCGIFGPGNQFPTDGIHVFDTSTWKRIQRSFNSGARHACCPPHFIYRFDNTLGGGQEPQGLTIWDLDDGRAPNVRGQLHVLLYNYNYNPFGNNGVYLKHYTNKLYVDASAPTPPPPSEHDEPPLLGTPEEPFNTVTDALNRYVPWDGKEIVIRAGSYHETGTFIQSTKFPFRVRFVSEGGSAILGQK